MEKTIMNEAVSRDEVESFLKETTFSGYQSVPLPHGLRIPGTDKSAAVEFYLAERVEGKSLLDIGTYYGLYPCEAMKRGASRAVGVELDPERYAIAKRVSELNGSQYEIKNSKMEEFDLDEKFDVVLFLNVLHHVLNPIEAVYRAANLCQDTLIIEFCLPWDYQYIVSLKGRNGSLAGKIWAKIRSRIMHAACNGLPIMAVADREYHRTFYFSPDAFYNIFVVHHRLFKSIEFSASPSNPDRAVAFCRV
jgi:SAM-dependent methyltransferase